MRNSWLTEELNSFLNHRGVALLRYYRAVSVVLTDVTIYRSGLSPILKPKVAAQALRMAVAENSLWGRQQLFSTDDEAFVNSAFAGDTGSTVWAL